MRKLKKKKCLHILNIILINKNSIFFDKLNKILIRDL